MEKLTPSGLSKARLKRFIHLEERDLNDYEWLQVDSVKSGLWHTLNCWGNVQHKLGDFVKKDSEIEYNREEIKQWVMHILQQEYGNEKLFKSVGVAPHRLTYEKLVAENIQVNPTYAGCFLAHPTGAIRRSAQY